MEVGYQMKIRSISIILMTTLMLTIFGFIDTYQVNAASGSTPYASAKVNSKEGAYVRKQATTSSGKVTILKDNTDIKIIKEVFTTKSSTSARDKWYQISVKGKSGYIRSDLVDNIKYSAVAGKVIKDGNYRVGPGTRMSQKGRFRTGKAVTVYMKASPVSSTAGSSATWYKVKAGSRYYYCASTYISIVGTIFVDNTDSPSGSSGSTTGNTPGTGDQGGSNMNDNEYSAYLSKLGFPDSYKSKLISLHRAHPNWVFIPKQTGVSWNDAVSKLSRNGVSLVEGSQPTSYRATDSNSFRSTGKRTVYKNASTSSGTVTSIASGTKFTLLTEHWSRTTRWSKIRTSSGATGYIKGSLDWHNFTSYIEGVTNDSDINIRTGAGTENSWVKTLPKGEKLQIVLQVRNDKGETWYKIRNGSGFAYIIARYVNVNSTIDTTKTVENTTLSDRYPKAKANDKIDYREMPDMLANTKGSFAFGSEFTVISQFNDSNGVKWYKAYKDGNIVYVQSDRLTLNSEPANASAPTKFRGRIKEDYVNYRTQPKTSGNSAVGMFNTGKVIDVTGIVKSGSKNWYRFTYNGKTYYTIADYTEIILDSAPADAAGKTTYETVTTKVAAKPENLQGEAYFMEGRWIPKDGTNWFNASSTAVAYYLDPRNFLNDDRIYMFEDLSYQKDYQTKQVVSKVIGGTHLPACGFSAQMFVNAGSAYNISPVFLAARARQETGGGSAAISGYRYNGKVVYNPFNIGATSSGNPVMNGLRYAYNKGWTTQTKALNGGAAFMANGYINAGQNTIYLQKFNVCNGAGKVATHQYMTNIQAPYHEAYTTKRSYQSYGITSETLTFSIPVFNGMPSATYLP